VGLKRHPALQPFSRDHLIGLFHAQRLIKLTDAETEKNLNETIAAFASAWEREISIHFADEDRLLAPLPVSDSNRQRLHDEHIELTALIEQILKKPHSAAGAAQVGKLLDAHIRWEEHDLFAEIEVVLSPGELEVLGQETDAIEKSRHRKLL
jgi:hemerythrin HHE cation binding domain-containing protein